jgi:RNA polymerase sigma factor (TIGR02999 family)
VDDHRTLASGGGDAPPERQETTALLKMASEGERDAASKLFLRLHDELHRRAVALFREERPGHFLQPTQLVHDAFLRLIDGDRIDWKDRSHFVALAAKVMRRILVDQARKERAEKRGGGRARVPLGEDIAAAAQLETDWLDLDDALRRLAVLHPRHAQVVELRFFGGLGMEDVAAVVGVALTTAENDWRAARAWLRRALGAE